MKKFILSTTILAFSFSVYASDQTPIEQKIEEQQPAAAAPAQVPEVIKNEAATQPVHKKNSQGSAWPDDEKKLEFRPTDEADKNSSFAAFREEFLQKLADKDKAFLLGAVDKKIKFSFGSYSDFKSFYSLDVSPKRSLVWDDLTKMLKLGGVFTPEGEFCTPYVYCLWPEGVKSSGMLAVIKENAEIKKSPGKGSATVGTVGYEIVKTSYNGAAQRSGWISIETRDGKKGFLRADDVRDPSDYRAWFKQNSDGKWLMTSYISGGF